MVNFPSYDKAMQNVFEIKLMNFQLQVVRILLDKIERFMFFIGLEDVDIEPIKAEELYWENFNKAVQLIHTEDELETFEKEYEEKTGKKWWI